MVYYQVFIKGYNSNYRDKENNQNDIYLNGKLKMHLRNCTLCPFKELIEDFLNDTCKEKHLAFVNIRHHILLEILRKGIMIQPKSFLLPILMSLYLIEHTSQFLKANIIIEKLAKRHLSIKDRTFLNFLKKKIIEFVNESNKNSSLNIQNVLNGQEFHQEFMSKLKFHIDYYNIFWNELRNDKVNLMKLIKLGRQIDQHFKIINLTWENYLQNLENHSLKPMVLYGYFLIVIKERSLLGKRILTRYHNSSIRLRGFDVSNNILEGNLFSEKNIYAIVNAHKDRLGQIISISPNVENLLSYLASALKSKNISEIMTAFFKQYHSHLILRYYETGENRVINQTRFHFAYHYNQYLVPIHLHVKMLPHTSDTLSFIGIIRLIRSEGNEYILLRRDGNIESMTPGLLKALNLTSKRLKKTTMFNLCLNYNKVNDAFNTYTDMAIAQLMNNMKKLNQASLNSIAQNNGNSSVHNISPDHSFASSEGFTKISMLLSRNPFFEGKEDFMNIYERFSGDGDVLIFQKYQSKKWRRNYRNSINDRTAPIKYLARINDEIYSETLMLRIIRLNVCIDIANKGIDNANKASIFPDNIVRLQRANSILIEEEEENTNPKSGQTALGLMQVFDDQQSHNKTKQISGDSDEIPEDYLSEHKLNDGSIENEKYKNSKQWIELSQSRQFEDEVDVEADEKLQPSKRFSVNPMNNSTITLLRSYPGKSTNIPVFETPRLILDSDSQIMKKCIPKEIIKNSKIPNIIESNGAIIPVKKNHLKLQDVTPKFAEANRKLTKFPQPSGRRKSTKLTFAPVEEISSSNVEASKLRSTERETIDKQSKKSRSKTTSSRISSSQIEQKIDNALATHYVPPNLRLKLNLFIIISIIALALSFAIYADYSTTIILTLNGANIKFISNHRSLNIIEMGRKFRVVWIMHQGLMNETSGISSALYNESDKYLDVAWANAQSLLQNSKDLHNNLGDMDSAYQTLFYDKIVRLYDVLKNGTVLDTFRSEDAFISTNIIHSYAKRLDKFKQRSLNETISLYYVLRNVFNDFLISSQNHETILENHIDSILNQTNQYSIILISIVSSLSFIAFIWISKTIWMHYTEKRNILGCLLRIQPMTHEHQKRLLQSFLVALDNDCINHNLLNTVDNNPIISSVKIKKKSNDIKLKFNSIKKTSLFLIFIIALTIGFSLIFLLGYYYQLKCKIASKKISSAEKRLKDQGLAIEMIYEYIGENITTTFRNNPISLELNQTLEDLSNLYQFIADLESDNDIFNQNMDFYLSGNICTIIPTSYISISDCMAIGGGIATNGLYKLNTYLYTSLSTSKHFFDLSNRNISAIMQVFQSKTLLEIENIYSNIMIPAYLDLVNSLELEFTNASRNFQTNCLIWLLIFIGMNILLIIVIWIPLQKTIIQEIDEIRYTLRILPKSIIINNILLKNFVIKTSEQIFSLRM